MTVDWQMVDVCQNDGGVCVTSDVDVCEMFTGLKGREGEGGAV